MGSDMSSKEMSDLEVDGKLLHAKKQAAIVLRTPQQTDDGMPGCWFGGKPTLPPDIEWPTFKSEVPGLDPVHLHFILQINLKYVPCALNFPEVPNRGTIFVFVEPMFAPKGVKQGPSLLQSDAATIIYVADDVSNCDPREAPFIPDVDQELPNGKSVQDYVCYSYDNMRNNYGMVETSAEVRSADGLGKWPIHFLLVDTYPTTEASLDFDASDVTLVKIDAYSEALREGIRNFRAHDYVQGNEYSCKTPHQLFGWHNLQPFPDQAYFDRLGVRPDVPSLSSDDVLLLTLHSEDEMIGFQYVGELNLAFWINKEDLAKSDFDSLTVWEQ